MTKKMLIDATHAEETRVAVVDGNRLVEYDYESKVRKQIKGSIFLAKITRVEPSLQAAFVNFGGNRHGFLPFAEIHPDYYRIPIADREALIADQLAEMEARRRAEEEEDREEESRSARAAGGAQGDDDAGDEEDDDEDEDEDIVEVGGSDKPAVDDEAHGDTETRGDLESSARPSLTDLPPLSGEPAGKGAIASASAAVESDMEGQPLADFSAEIVLDHGAELAPEDTGPIAEAVVNQPALYDTETIAEITLQPAFPDETDESKQAQPGNSAGFFEESNIGNIVDDGEFEGEDVDGNRAGFDTHDQNHNGDAGPGQGRDRNRGRGRGRDRDRGRGSRNNRGRSRSAAHSSRRVEIVGGDGLEGDHPIRPTARRHYKIQEVIKRGQIMLVQASKEERGNKGAAVTTYLSLPGRYCVLMPNSPRGGGVSRKIANFAERRRMRELLTDLQVPEGMSVIMRTAGVSRTKAEIKRDLDYLMRLWDEIRETTLASTAPAPIHEEGNLVRRSIRDIYTSEIDEVIVSGENGYKFARDFMRMMIPSHVKRVAQYKDERVPLFNRYGIENQIREMSEPTVQLRSGGYLVINPTEALVSIDVNSGRATKERHIEETAVKTNLEAAEEVARQLRLRDLGGLVVIDFIDMEDRRNNRRVEERLKQALSSDRARIQVGRISSFGLLELSRQRMNPSLTEAQFEKCAHCAGTGVVRTTDSAAILALRALEEEAARSKSGAAMLHVPSSVALYILNNKREMLDDIERRFAFRVTVNVDEHVEGGYRIEALKAPVSDDEESDDRGRANPRERNDRNRNDRNDRNDRGDRGRDRFAERPVQNPVESVDEADLADSEADAPNPGETEDEQQEGRRSGRRRGRRGGRRRRGGRDQSGEPGNEAGSDFGGNGDGEDFGSPAADEATVSEMPEQSGLQADDSDLDLAGNDAALAGIPPEEIATAAKPRSRRTRSRKTADKVTETVTEEPVMDDAAAPVEKPARERRPRGSRSIPASSMKRPGPSDDAAVSAPMPALQTDRPANDTTAAATTVGDTATNDMTASDMPANDDLAASASEPVPAVRDYERVNEAPPSKKKGWWNRFSE